MNSWSSQSILTNGIRVHYHRTGGRDKPVLLMTHGFTDNGLCWSRTAHELESDYDILMLDTRGHGLSDKPEEGYASADHAKDVAGLIEALGLGPVLILGHSIGATTAATLAANHPHLVRAALLEDPPWREADDPLNFDTPEKIAVVLKEWRKQLETQQKMRPEEIENLGRERSPGWHDDEFPSWVESKQQVSPDVVKAITTENQHWITIAAKIKCPVLLITGDPSREAIVSPAIAKQVQSVNPRIKHVHIDGAGHNIHRECFEPFVGTVRAFLHDLSREPLQAQ